MQIDLLAWQQLLSENKLLNISPFVSLEDQIHSYSRVHFFERTPRDLLITPMEAIYLLNHSLVNELNLKESNTF